MFAAVDELKQEGKILDYGVSVELVEEASKHRVAAIARVPLASGLLPGRFRADTMFEQNDHRQFNRQDEAADIGETFSGVPYEVGLAAVERVRPLVGDDTTMALRIAMNTDVRPGDSRHSRRAQAGTGEIERGGIGSAAAIRHGNGRASCDLRPAHPPADTRADSLVKATAAIRRT